MAVHPIPEGYHSVTPYLAVAGAEKAIAFYEKVFGARKLLCMKDPKSGKVGHAEIQIGDSRVMLADEHPEMDFKGPAAHSPVHLHLYVEDVDMVAGKAVEAGAKQTRPVADQFYGDRSGSFQDPFGHVWHVATHKEDLSEEEIGRRAAEQLGKH